jgi:hypothetical protein
MGRHVASQLYRYPVFFLSSFEFRMWSWNNQIKAGNRLWAIATEDNMDKYYWTIVLAAQYPWMKLELKFGTHYTKFAGYKFTSTIFRLTSRLLGGSLEIHSSIDHLPSVLIIHLWFWLTRAKEKQLSSSSTIMSVTAACRGFDIILFITVLWGERKNICGWVSL